MNHSARGEDSQVLAVLEALAEETAKSQRQLSHATGLNLAKVNFLLRRLADKGMVKLKNISENPNKLAYLYILTPQGMAEKAKLTYRFIERTMIQYQEIEGRVRSGLERLAKEGAGRVVLIGNGEMARIFMEAIRQIPGLTLAGVIDSAAASGEAGEQDVLSPERIAGMEFDRIVIADMNYAEDLAATCQRLGVDKEKVWSV